MNPNQDVQTFPNQTFSQTSDKRPIHTTGNPEFPPETKLKRLELISTDQGQNQNENQNQNVPPSQSRPEDPFQANTNDLVAMLAADESISGNDGKDTANRTAAATAAQTPGNKSTCTEKSAAASVANLSDVTTPEITPKESANSVKLKQNAALTEVKKNWEKELAAIEEKKSTCEKESTWERELAACEAGSKNLNKVTSQNDTSTKSLAPTFSQAETSTSTTTDNNTNSDPTLSQHKTPPTANPTSDTTASDHNFAAENHAIQNFEQVPWYTPPKVKLESGVPLWNYTHCLSSDRRRYFSFSANHYNQMTGRFFFNEWDGIFRENREQTPSGPPNNNENDEVPFENMVRIKFFVPEIKWYPPPKLIIPEDCKRDPASTMVKSTELAEIEKSHNYVKLYTNNSLKTAVPPSEDYSDDEGTKDYPPMVNVIIKAFRTKISKESENKDVDGVTNDVANEVAGNKDDNHNSISANSGIQDAPIKDEDRKYPRPFADCHSRVPRIVKLVVGSEKPSPAALAQPTSTSSSTHANPQQPSLQEVLNQQKFGKTNVNNNHPMIPPTLSSPALQPNQHPPCYSPTASASSNNPNNNNFNSNQSTVNNIYNPQYQGGSDYHNRNPAHAAPGWGDPPPTNKGYHNFNNSHQYGVNSTGNQASWEPPQATNQNRITSNVASFPHMQSHVGGMQMQAHSGMIQAQQQVHMNQPGMYASQPQRNNNIGYNVNPNTQTYNNQPAPWNQNNNRW